MPPAVRPGERSSYGPLANLLNTIGATLRPKVFCVGELADQGVGHPDFGLYGAKQVQRLTTGRARDSGLRGQGSAAAPALRSSTGVSRSGICAHRCCGHCSSSFPIPARLQPLGLVEVLDWTAAALDRVDKSAFFARFNEGEAVPYFYEPFLEAFDPALRKQLGVWYTPTEVVRYMVARVDRALKDDVDIPDGLAAENVYVLDPCCGTGAYLAEVLRRIAANLEGRGLGALVGARVKQAATERVKQETPILVILGNPPYNGFAGMAVDEERELSEAYRTPKRVRRPEGQGLNDLYVRFFRMAERRIAERTGRGVVCFISKLLLARRTVVHGDAMMSSQGHRPFHWMPNSCLLYLKACMPVRRNPSATPARRVGRDAVGASP